MAMLDYGAIVIKNGKLINDKLFTPMIDMVGWEDTENDTYKDEHGDTRPLDLKDNYFAYIGDKDCTIAFFKTHITIVYWTICDCWRCTHEYFASSNYTWTRSEDYVGVNDDGSFVKLVLTKRNGYFVCKWKYKGDRYKVYFGYGLSPSHYKKWRIVNYYRSPGFTLRRAGWWFKDKWLEWKYRD